jgi:hypothetical protein
MSSIVLRCVIDRTARSPPRAEDGAPTTPPPLLCNSNTPLSTHFAPELSHPSTSHDMRSTGPRGSCHRCEPRYWQAWNARMAPMLWRRRKRSSSGASSFRSIAAKNVRGSMPGTSRAVIAARRAAVLLFGVPARLPPVFRRRGRDVRTRSSVGSPSPTALVRVCRSVPQPLQLHMCSAASCASSWHEQSATLPQCSARRGSKSAFHFSRS